MMISTKRKRKLEYQGIKYYWYIKKDSDHISRIHIMSEDKSLQLVRGFDREIGIGTQYIRDLLSRHLGR